VLEGLPGADVGALLASVIPGRLDERVRDRISVESSGNPVAQLELPYGVTAAELAGGFGVVGPVPLAGRIGQRFRRRITPLPKATRRLLLLAAAEPGLHAADPPDPHTHHRAAQPVPRQGRPDGVYRSPSFLLLARAPWS
jgi:hypothetical protein